LPWSGDLSKRTGDKWRRRTEEKQNLILDKKQHRGEEGCQEGGPSKTSEARAAPSLGAKRGGAKRIRTAALLKRKEGLEKLSRPPILSRKKKKNPLALPRPAEKKKKKKKNKGRHERDN